MRIHHAERWTWPALVLGLLAPAAGTAAHAELLSWNDGPARQAIVAFVERVTKEGGPDFVPSSERIAVFDNDGTLWFEQTMYVQLAFALERVEELAPRKPEWKEREPFRSVLAGDLAALARSGEGGLLELARVGHVGAGPAPRGPPAPRRRRTGGGV